MRLALLSLVLCGSACQPVELAVMRAEWSSSPAELDFGSALSRDLTLTNRSRLPIELTLDVAQPFSAPRVVRLAAAESRTVAVHVDALTEGEIVSLLTVQSETQTQVVPLRASAITCAPSRACERAERSETGECVRTAEADGVACTTGCIGSGICSAGECTGVARDCDDHDACTDDACGTKGCTHVARSCPRPDDACQVATCDSRLGCVVAPAEDGARCGEATCSTSRVCIAGACVERPTPDGAACGTESPCQSLGVCEGQRCVQPPPHPLVADWVYRPAQGTVFLDVPGIADTQGNLYWVERANAENWLVSTTGAGALRYRALLEDAQSPGYAAWNDMLLSGDSVVLSSAASDSVEVRDAATGALRWFVRLIPELLVAWYREAGCSAQAAGALQSDVVRKWSLAADGAAQIAIALDVQSSCLGSDDLWLIVLDADTGAVRWATPNFVSRAGQGFWVQRAELAYDEQGNLTALFRAPTLADSTIASFAPSGVERWRNVEAGTGRPLKSLAQGNLVVSRYSMTGALTSEVISLLDGTSRQWAPVSSAVTGLAAGTTATLIDFAQAPQLVSFDFASATATVHPLLLHESELASPVMTSRQTLLVASASGNGMWLQEFAMSDGAALATCELAGARLDAWSAPVLSGGRWIVSARGEVRAYPAFGAAAASSGWVTSRGQPTRNGSPRSP